MKKKITQSNAILNQFRGEPFESMTSHSFPSTLLRINSQLRVTIRMSMICLKHNGEKMGLATLISVCIMFIVPMVARAQTAMPTPNVGTTVDSTTSASGSLVATDSASTGTPSDIRKLRDRLASVVAELRKKDEQVIAGEVKSIDTANLEVDTIAGIVEKIQLDDTLTKYYRLSGAAKEEIEQKDVKEGSYVIVTGLRTEGSFSANELYIDEPFDSKAGRITEIDSDKGTYKLETFDKETLTVVVGRSTYQQYFNAKTISIEQGGFSKTKEGDTAHVVYALKSIKSQPTVITPARMFVIPLEYFSK